MIELLEKLETAHAGSDKLDEAVALAFGWEKRWKEIGGDKWHEPGMAASIECELPSFHVIC
jgi:hypothetical protein